MMPRFLAGVLMLLAAAGSVAQAPHEDWRTLNTEHYRIHYPKAYEDWARHAAGKLEEIRTLVSPVVGYEPSEITDVIVADPLAVPNGSAWPFIGSPRMVLWASPPGPGSMLSHQSDWAELVAIHEDVHLVHLLRPTRKPLGALGWFLLPIRTGPMRGAPRWAVEGYATLIEGQLTGRGRPHSDLRASVLRRWAQQGRLPTYGRLASDSATWLGQSMAYLVGSAYLEWLVEREGEGSLRAVWTRLTAKQSRTFEQAFEGVYGDSPERLYQRFTAELTQRALTVESALASSSQEGELWQDFSWFTDLPHVSPDGNRLVTVRRSKEGPAALVILSTAPDTEAEETRQSQIDEMLSKDPDDVAPVRRKPAERKPEYRLARTSGATPQTPRWIGDTGHVLFVESGPDRNGFMHPDLFRWNPRTDEVWRLTVEAGLRDADPISKGAGAIAVRSRFGASQLVEIDFSSGQITPMTPASITEVYGTPRVSPEEERIAYVVQRDGQWRLVVRDRASGEERERVFDGTVAHPAWSPDGMRLYASIGSEGFVEIWEFGVAGTTLDEGRQLTRSSMALFGPTAGPDAIFFLAMDVDGIELRRLGVEAFDTPKPPLDLPSTLAPAIGVVPGEVRARLTPTPLGADRPYGFGRIEFSPLFGGSLANSGGTLEFGCRLGDTLGRTDIVVMGSVPSGGAAAGGLVAGVTRRWPVRLAFTAVSADERPSEQGFDGSSGALVADRDRVAVEIEASRRLYWRASSVEVGMGTWWSAIDAGERDSANQWGWFGRVAQEGRPTSGPWAYPHAANLDVAAGSTDGRSFTRVVGRFSFGVMRKGSGVEIDLARGDVDDDAHELDRFEAGGLRTSLHAGSAVFGNRVWAPALPFGALKGSSFTRVRGSIVTSLLPVSFFVERIETSSERLDASITSAGAEFAMDIAAMPLVRIPGAAISAGVAFALDSPVEDEVRGWVGLRWHP